MVNFTPDAMIDLEAAYDECEAFERIRPQRETVMPVGSCRNKAKGRRRNSPPKRTHRTPKHCRGAALRHVRRWN